MACAQGSTPRMNLSNLLIETNASCHSNCLKCVDEKSVNRPLCYSWPGTKLRAGLRKWLVSSKVIFLELKDR